MTYREFLTTRVITPTQIEAAEKTIKPVGDFATAQPSELLAELALQRIKIDIIAQCKAFGVMATVMLEHFPAALLDSPIPQDKVMDFMPMVLVFTRFNTNFPQ
ncbi:MAG: hypothetical protein RL094_413 [Candidatus Parcubacteria bacterium]|jgi:hypothetical protein